jgi:hypothetical protein
MKQIWPNYSYSPATNVLTLTGLNIDRDQLLLVTAADRGRIMYNFADSSVTASAFTSGANTALTLVATTAGLTTTASLVIYYDDQLASTTVTVSSLPAISGTVTISALPSLQNNTDFVLIGEQIAEGANNYGTIAIGADWWNASQGIGNLNVTATCVTSTNRIGVVTIGGGTVTIGAGTAQIGSVTASISNFPATQAISISSVTVGNSVTIASLPALSAGTAQIGSVTASLAISSSAITSGSFSSLTSATLVPANTARKMATVYNLGAGQLFINAGASATTLGGGFMVALSSGDFYECDYTTTTLSAIFATAGTASWMSH